MIYEKIFAKKFLSTSSSLIRFQSTTIINNDLIKNTLLRRSILYVPGNDERKINKALKSYENIDSIVLDCEDGVAISSKNDARNTISKILNENYKNDSLWNKLSVRINSMDSKLANDDLSVILSMENYWIPRTILLPKVDTKENIDEFFDLLFKYKINERLKHSLDLITYVESAIGLLDLRDIAKYTLDMCKKIPNLNFSGIVFGSDDFCANIGATRTKNCDEILMARQYMILVCKSLNLQAIDSVYIDFRDLDGLKKHCIDSAIMGFTGKQCIHPDQISIVQQSYSPSDEKIKWATGLINEFELQQKQGRGAFVYNNQMIDMPLLKQAYNIINIAKQIK